MPVHILIQSAYCIGSVTLNSKKKKKAMSFGMERKLENVKKGFILIEKFISLSIFFK